MKICLAATGSKGAYIPEISNIKYMLESFFYIEEWQIEYIKKCELFLLDSGAFTFMSNTKKQINWEEYVDKYIEFINKNDVEYFFELDIDSIVGYKKVLELRRKLEKGTNKKCIPVWHKSRGLEEWKKMTKEYDYVAIGGIVTKEIAPKDYIYFTPLLDIAKKNNCKVHGLGFTAIAQLSKYKFYSVDSTSWVSGSRFGQLHEFKDGKMTTYKPKDKRADDYKKIDAHNLKQWIKFQQYADAYL